MKILLNLSLIVVLGAVGIGIYNHFFVVPDFLKLSSTDSSFGPARWATLADMKSNLGNVSGHIKKYGD